MSTERYGHPAPGQHLSREAVRRRGFPPVSGTDQADGPGWKRFDADVLEQGLHADAQGLAVAVDGGPDFGFTAYAGAADSGEDRCDDVVAQGVIGHPPTVGGCGISRQPDCPERGYSFRAKSRTERTHPVKSPDTQTGPWSK